MTTSIRNIIRIDEDKCNGCGACIPACKEGALVIEDGKAKLVSDVYCDGLGACLGTCPQGAITIESREADAFDEKKAMDHVAHNEPDERRKTKDERRDTLPCGCPGMMSTSLKPKTSSGTGDACMSSQLSHWPVQLRLIPSNAPYLKGAELLLLADCAAVAYANLHRDLLRGKVVAMACPKLDDAEAYIEKLARVVAEGGPASIEVVMMEVPCCSGLFAIAEKAVQRAGSTIELSTRIVSVEGGITSMSS